MEGREGKREVDLRWVGIVFTGAVPWVDNSISHQLCVCLALRCLGHAASQRDTYKTWSARYGVRSK